MIGRAYKPCGHNRAYVDETKQQARSFIVSCWREFSGRSGIPGQYVTLCGPLADHGALRENAELRQLEVEGLYKPSQFVGVNHDDELQIANKRAVAAHYAPSDQPLLLTGDIIDVLHDLHSQQRLDASIVYLDTTSLLRAAAPLLWQTLNIQNHFNGPRLVAWTRSRDAMSPKTSCTHGIGRTSIRSADASRDIPASISGIFRDSTNPIGMAGSCSDPVAMNRSKRPR